MKKNKKKVSETKMLLRVAKRNLTLRTNKMKQVAAEGAAPTKGTKTLNHSGLYWAVAIRENDGVKWKILNSKLLSTDYKSILDACDTLKRDEASKSNSEPMIKPIGFISKSAVKAVYFESELDMNAEYLRPKN